MMLVFVSVLFKLGTVKVPFKMSPDLIAYIFKIIVVSKIVSAVIFYGAYAFANSSDRLHYPDCIYIPRYRRLPVNAVQNAFYRFICGNGVTELLPSHTGKYIRKQSISAVYTEFNCIAVYLHFCTSFIIPLTIMLQVFDLST